MQEPTPESTASRPAPTAASAPTLIARIEAVADAAERSFGSRCLSALIRVVFWLSLLAVVVFLSTIALTRFWLVPNADSFRPRIVEELSRVTKQRVALGSLEAGWNGWSPEFKISRLQILDSRGRAVLELPEIETTVSWRSLLVFEPRLSTLTVKQPRVIVRRDDENRISVAGFDMDLASTEPSDPSLLEWLLRQRYVQIEGGEIEWQDAWKKLPPLRLRDVNLRLQNEGAAHRMGLRAAPVGDIAAPIEIRSEFSGTDLRKINDWDGRAYVRLDYADMGALARYLPLPVEVGSGHGALQAWFDFDNGEATSVTADVVLRNTAVRLVREMRASRPVAAAGAPSAQQKTTNDANATSAAIAAMSATPVSFAEVTGRIEWRDETPRSALEKIVKRGDENVQRWRAVNVSILPTDRPRLTPINAELSLATTPAGSQRGNFNASLIDLKSVDTLHGALSPLLPTAVALQDWIQDPTGELRDVRASWNAGATPPTFLVKASASGVSWQRGKLPGVAGLSGTVETSERAGGFKFESTTASASSEKKSGFTLFRASGGAAATKDSPALSASGLTLDFGDRFEAPLRVGSVSGGVRWERISNAASAAATPPPTPAAPTALAAPNVSQNVSTSVSQNVSTNSPQGASTRGADAYLVTLDSLSAQNADVRATLNGTWRSDDIGPGIAKITGKLEQVNATAVHRYLPRTVGESARAWVQGAVQAGVATNASLNLEGALWHFPFADGKHGKFEIVAPVTGVTIDYADRWPRAENVEATLKFKNASFEAEVAKATIANAAIAATTVRIADMSVAEPVVEIKGTAASSVDNFLRFVASSPVNRMLDGFTEKAKGSGPAKLNLSLAIPIASAERTKLDGELVFENNRVELGGEIPPLENVSGRLRFSERAVNSKELRATAFGGATAIDINTDATGAIRAAANGRAELARVRDAFDYPLLDQLQGSLDWKLEAQASMRGATASPTVNVSGVISPQALPIDRVYQAGAQPRDVSLPVAFNVTRVAQADGRDRIELELPSLLHVIAERAAEAKTGARTVERAVVDFGAQKTQLPIRGYSMRGELAKLDVDAALELLPALTGGNAKNVGGLQADSAAPDFINVNLRADRALVFAHVLNDVSLRAQPGVGRWRLALRSKEATGLISLESPQENGAISAVAVRLQRFSLPAAMTAQDRLALSPRAASLVPPANTNTRWPKLDLTADSFLSEGRDLGKLEIAAQPSPDEWRIDRVKLASADGALDAKGRWRLPTTNAARAASAANSNAANGNTSVEVALDWKDAGKFMQRFGLPKGVERGEGQLRGELSWLGSPAEFGYSKLDGKFTLKTAAGRFTEMDPGVGKLIGIISLQSIPRRLSFNFDDIFRSGYAFDSIEGEVQITKGVAKTDAFTIAGPAARVEIRGDANLESELTQLRVRVFPSVSVATAIGIGLATANPAIGAAAWLGQKIARDPVERLLMQEYEIGGTWGNPEVKQTRGVGAGGDSDTQQPPNLR